MAKILLIEDEDDERAYYRMLIETLGHVVIEAREGAEGLKAFRETAPDIVLTDLVMPVKEGFETIRSIKELDPYARILAMSRGGTNPAGAYLRVAQKFGASQVLAKPFSVEELSTAISQLLPKELPVASTKAFTFLVLDDNATARFLNRSLIEGAFPRSTIVECGSVTEAVDTSARIRLDAVITDHHLGEEGGDEFVRRIRAQGAACPVLMVTNSSDPHVHERAYAAGASRVFFGANTNFTSYLRAELMKAGGA